MDGAATVEVVGVADLADLALGDDAAVADQPAERSRSEGAAREAEDEDLVAGLVVEHEEPVRVGDTIEEAPAEDAGRPGLEPADDERCSNALDVADDLVDAVIAHGFDVLRSGD